MNEYPKAPCPDCGTALPVEERLLGNYVVVRCPKDGRQIVFLPRVI
jgi:hypothetical protein